MIVRPFAGDGYNVMVMKRSIVAEGMMQLKWRWVCSVKCCIVDGVDG